MTWLEAIATVFGIICVWLTVRQHLWCWPMGLIQVTLYTYIFYEAKLYSDTILHIIYIILNMYGWYYWSRGTQKLDILPVTLLQRRVLLWVTVAVAGTALWGFTMARYTDASVPYLDAFTTVASLIAQWLMTRKKLESWLFWIAVDIIAIGVYWHKELYITSGLYTVFLVLATLGYFEWRKSYRAEQSNLSSAL